MTEIIESNLPKNVAAVLSGPNHAEEVGKKLATAAVIGCKDKNVAKKIQKVKEIAIIIIVHKLSLIKDADQIVVLNDGQIECTGHHKKLIGFKNWYSDSLKS